MQKIFLVRHAESSMNGRYCGSIDAPLSSRGVAQAKVCGRNLKNKAFDVCFVSDLRRTLETASYLLKGRDIPLLKCPSLREIRFGDWEGKVYITVERRYPLLYNRWMKNPTSIQIPNGESFSDFCERIEGFYKFLLQNRCRNVLVVAHGGTLSVLKMILLHRNKSEFWRWVPQLASISVLKRVGDSTSFICEN